MRKTNQRMTLLMQDGEGVRREIDGLKRQAEGIMYISLFSILLSVYSLKIFM
jgi:hypothetical protein